MLKGNRDVNDTSGGIPAKTEWNFLYDLAKNKEGFLEKEAIRGLYDGSLFEYFEKQHSASAQAQLP
jgi:peroxygenase